MSRVWYLHWPSHCCPWLLTFKKFLAGHLWQCFSSAWLAWIISLDKTNFTSCKITHCWRDSRKEHATQFNVSVRCYVSAPACSPCKSSSSAYSSWTCLGVTAGPLVLHSHLNGAPSKGLNLSVHFCISLDCYYLINFDSSFSYPQIQLWLKAKPLFLVKMQVNVESWHKKGEKILFLGSN